MPYVGQYVRNSCNVRNVRNSRHVRNVRNSRNVRNVRNSPQRPYLVLLNDVIPFNSGVETPYKELQC